MYCSNILPLFKNEYKLFIYFSRFENSELLKPTITPDGRKVYEPARPYFSGNTEQINQRIAEENQKMGHRPTVRNEEYNDEDEEEKSRNRQKRQSFNGHDEHFCTKDTCATIECTIKTLPKDHEVTVTFRSLVWMKTIKKVSSGHSLFILVNIGRRKNTKSLCRVLKYNI